MPKGPPPACRVGRSGTCWPLASDTEAPEVGSFSIWAASLGCSYFFGSVAASSCYLTRLPGERDSEVTLAFGQGDDGADLEVEPDAELDLDAGEAQVDQGRRLEVGG
jgi:hypothetical protein